MTALDDLRAAVRQARSAYSNPPLVYHVFALIDALPDSPEVPEGKVLVDEWAVREVRHWRYLGGKVDNGPPINGAALDAIASALPAPEWEPSDELVKRYCAEFHANQCVERCRSAPHLKRLHRAGLLNPEVTDG